MTVCTGTSLGVLTSFLLALAKAESEKGLLG